MRHRKIGIVTVMIWLVIVVLAGVLVIRPFYIYFTYPSIEEIAQSDEWDAVEIEVLDVEIEEDDEGCDTHSIEVESRYDGKIISGEFSGTGDSPDIKIGDTLDGYVNIENYELAYESYRTEFDGAAIDNAIFGFIMMGIIAVISIISSIIKKVYNRIKY